MTGADVLAAYRAIRRAHPDLRHHPGPQILTALERKLSGDTAMTCAELDRLLPTHVAEAMGAKLRGPRMFVVECPQCRELSEREKTAHPRFFRSPTPEGAETQLKAHLTTHA